jgi:hypothetical protein
MDNAAGLLAARNWAMLGTEPATSGEFRVIRLNDWEETHMISRRFTAAALGLVLALAAAPQLGWASDHLKQAIWETKEAIAAGNHGQAASFVEHSVEAVHHAHAAQAQRPSDHIKKGIVHLKKGIKLAKRTSSVHRVEKATAHAETALSHLEAVR